MADLRNAYEELVARYKEYSCLGSVVGLLHWDMQAMMPPKGVKRRTEQLTLLSGMMHKKLTSDRIGELLDMLKAGHNTLSEEKRANVREMDRDYKKATKIPLELVEKMAREQAMGHEVWVKAREAADFGIFAPNLERMVKLAAEQAEYLGYGGTSGRKDRHAAGRAD